MSSPQQTPGCSWQPAIFILSFFTLLSLVVNAFLLWLVWAGWQLYQEEVPPLLEEAASMGKALQENIQEPLNLEFAVDERLPLQLDVPIDHTVVVAIDDIATVDKTFLLEWDLPIVGLVTKTIPIHFDVPIHIEAPVHVSTTVPISVAVPIQMTIPIEIDLMDFPMGEDLLHLGKVLEGITAPGIEP